MRVTVCWGTGYKLVLNVRCRKRNEGEVNSRSICQAKLQSHPSCRATKDSEQESDTLWFAFWERILPWWCSRFRLQETGHRRYLKHVFKGLLSAQHNITFYIFEKSPGWGSTAPAQRQPPDTPSAVTPVGHLRVTLSGDLVPMVCSLASPPIPVTPPCGGLAVEVEGPLRFRKMRSHQPNRPNWSFHRKFSSCHLLSAASIGGWGHSPAALQLGTGYPRRFQTRLFAFSPEQCCAYYRSSGAAQGTLPFAAQCPGASHRAVPSLAGRPPGSAR